MSLLVRVLFLLLIALPAAAQSTWTNGDLNVNIEGRAGTPPAVIVAPPAFRGNGTLSVSASALINTMTVNSSGAALPATLGAFTVIANTGDVALCAAGGTCTCPANGAAATNGDTVKAGGGSYGYYLPTTASTTPTVVSCSGTAIVEFQW